MPTGRRGVSIDEKSILLAKKFRLVFDQVCGKILIIKIVDAVESFGYLIAKAASVVDVSSRSNIDFAHSTKLAYDSD
jgi:hypothetical protein